MKLAGMHPSRKLAVARMRADALARLRAFFAERDVLEVETPMLSRGISLDVHLDFFSARFHPGGASEGPTSSDHYLQTSPEPHLKRLLCHGFPDLYQVAKSFRNGESGPRHNPEFTMVEWYRRDWGMEAMQEETLEFCQLLAGPRPVMRYTWEEAFLATLGFNPLDMDVAGLLARPEITSQGLGAKDFSSLPDLWDFLMAHAVEPRLNPEAFTSIRYFPALQAGQSEVHPQRPDLAMRFEVYSGGVELGNGYQELRDVDEYRIRFQDQLRQRALGHKPCPPIDGNLLNDLGHFGLPPCSGVAVGLDRLLMLASGRETLGEVLLFPWGEH